MQEILKSLDHADVYQVVVKAVPVSYPGEAVPLLPPKPLRTAGAIPVLWKTRIANCMSHQTRQRIRQGLSLLGIRL